ncbi:MAG: glycosyltransferase family 9 protein [Flavobacteriales bacterium]|nr:glycosyltransferase family 9 protein [Flavobacteriales bacterium]
MKSTTHILVVRFSSIGDIVLTTPIIRGLKEQLEGEVHVDFITKAKYASIVESNPFIDRVITIENKVSEVTVELESTPYDYVVDLHNNIRSRQVKSIVKTLSFTIDKRNLAKWVYINLKKLHLPIGHFTARCFQTVQALGVEDDGNGLDFFIPDDQAVSANILPAHFHSGFVAYAIGGLEAGKILPTRMIIELCREIKKPIVLLGGPEDKGRGEEIAAAVGESVWNSCGSFSLNKSASLLSLASCVITHDTGLMHIASALKKKVISLWLATTPEIGFAPWQPGEGSVMIEADCKKRPTSKLGNRGFEDGCVYNIDLQKIARHCT